ncbi:MAG: homoserine kinase [Ilumatobacter sp.]|uniref:homoserine kinase n=1 Tax=Ilumatobacter sp. TaxID=1967498 RepID=UPI0026078DE9|nr:homoserine kinase [Ilumatobacter sp.]MDJ0771579.1 homoserine kinase [Ilumatobacter sp.]
MSGWAIRVPASSANLGAGFDVLGLALTLYAEVGCGEPPAGARAADEHHPATVAFRRCGGEGALWIRSSIPVGRGLGFSGTVRVGGAAAAVVQRAGRAALDEPEHRSEVLAVASELESHADNVAPSLHGGLVVAAAGRATSVPLAFDPAVVVWVPAAATTSTDRSRAQLSDSVDRADAVFNLGRVAMFVAACSSGDSAALRAATEDRMHQAVRLADVPDSAAALEAGLDAGAWAAWLSGSGPTVAMFAESKHADRIAEALPANGHSKVLRIDHEGAVVADGVDASDGSAVTGVDSAATDGTTTA